MRADSVLFALIFLANSMPLMASSSNVRYADARTRVLHATVEMFKEDIGRRPAASEWPRCMADSCSLDGWDGPYVNESQLHDPWGRFYSLSLREELPDGFGIHSFGRDGVDQNGAGDDISSWAGYDREIYSPGRFRGIKIAMAALALCAVVLWWRAVNAQRRRAAQCALTH